MTEIEKKTKCYPTDLTDEEWARIEPFLPGAAKSGRPARTDLREVLNAIRYQATAILRSRLNDPMHTIIFVQRRLATGAQNTSRVFQTTCIGWQRSNHKFCLR